VKLTVDVNQEVDRPPLAAIDRLEIAGQARRDRFRVEKRLQFAKLPVS